MNILKNLAVAILISCSAYAQSDRMHEKREQIKALKIAFLTTELNLTAAEAQKFWPIYTAFEEKEFELRHLKMKSFIRRYKEGKDKMNEKEASLLLSQIENNEDELVALRKKFSGSIKGVLPSLKIIGLKKAEENFNRKLLMQYRNKAQQKE